MARLKPSLICVVLMVFLRRNQAQQGLLANISMVEAATAAANARYWMQRQNAGRTLGSGCSGDKCIEACGEDWERNGDHCYFWGTDKKNWTEAEDFCQREGGHLASVTTHATKDFVLEGMNRTGLDDSAHLGGNDIEQEGTWNWADCTPWEVTFWTSSQPDNGGGNQNCLRQVLKLHDDATDRYTHKWDDDFCSRKFGFVCSKKICSGPVVELEPVAATLSSTYSSSVGSSYGAGNCIDGDTETMYEPGGSALCHTNNTNTPWIAIDYGTRVMVERVEIFNRADCCGDRTRNVDVRISDELPTSGSKMFSGGTLLGHFAGPATNGQHIIVSGQETSGRYVIVQINGGKWRTYLNFQEVKAFGRVARGSVPKNTTENAVTGDSMMWKPASGFLISTILLLLFLF